MQRLQQILTLYCDKLRPNDQFGETHLELWPRESRPSFGGSDLDVIWEI